jgi:hypothetical protein
MGKINVLGTIYTIEIKDVNEDNRLDKVEAYTDLYGKKIVITNLKTRKYFANESLDKIKVLTNKLIRHEIIHAFLYESGLDCNSEESCSWAENEEMVDWFAIQSPKIMKVFKELNIEE